MTNLYLTFYISFCLGLALYVILRVSQKPEKIYTRKQVEKAILEARNHDLHKDEIIENL